MMKFDELCGWLTFDLIAEVTQLYAVTRGAERFEYHGGSTIILDTLGEVRYVILKSVVGANRLERRREFLQSEAGKQFWQRTDGHYVPRKGLFRLLHDDNRP